MIPKATSCGVTGSPFSHLMPSRSVNFHSVKSLFGVPRSVARSGIRTICLVAGSYLYCVRLRNISPLPIALVSVKYKFAGSIGVVRPVWVYTVTVPPFLAPVIVTGPLAFASLPDPVWPSFSPFTLLFPELDEPPPPPQAASARSAAVPSAMAGFLNRISCPFRGWCDRRRGEFLSAGLGVEGVSDRVAEKVQDECQERDGADWHPQVERVVAVVVGGVGDHLAERRDAGEAEAEEGEQCLCCDEGRQLE